MFQIDYTSISFLLSVSVFVLFIVQLFYFLGLYSRLYKTGIRQNRLPENENCPPLSVIIVTKDSSSMLKDNLPCILEQDYPEFEVIVVNDESAGEDEDILKLLEKNYSNLYHTFIPKSARYISRKKLGVAMGIKASKYDWIVLTEPYCKPSGNKWLRSMARYFNEGTDVVLGYCNYNTSKGYFAKHITSDLIIRYMRIFGRAIAHSPYMGFGTNLAFRKNAYDSHKGFSKQLNLLRGEDDLFVNEISNSRNTQVVVSAESLMTMPVPENKNVWKGERTSYEVTGHFYRGSARFFNAMESMMSVFFNISVLVALGVCYYNQEFIYAGIVCLLWIIRFLIAMTVFVRTSKVVGSSLRSFFIFYNFMRPFYSISNKFRYWTRNKVDYMRR